MGTKSTLRTEGAWGKEMTNRDDDKTETKETERGKAISLLLRKPMASLLVTDHITPPPPPRTLPLP